MKKCPFCAEEIQDEANKCKYCGEWLAKIADVKENQEQKTVPESLVTPVDNTRGLKIIGWILLVIFALWLWYISLPILAIWYLFYKTDLGKKLFTNVKNKSKKIGYKKIATRTLLVIIIITAVSVIIAYPNRKPTITITEPKNNDKIQSDRVLIKGTVSPSRSNVSVKTGNGEYLEIVDGRFSFEAPLNQESNTFILSAFNKEEVSNISITIKRIYNDGEKAQIAKKAQEEQDAKILADKIKQEELAAQQKIEEENRIKEQEAQAKIDAENKRIADAEEKKKEQEEQLALANEEKDFKASCTSISYAKLKKDSYSYVGENVYYKGKIEQAGSELFSEWFRISITSMGYGYYTDTIWVNYMGTTDFAEDDVVRFWGTVDTPHCYKSQAGWDICIPAVDAKYLSK